MAGGRHWRDLIQRPLYNAWQPSRCEGPLSIVEPPLSTDERMSANDPKERIANDCNMEDNSNTWKLARSVGLL